MDRTLSGWSMLVALTSPMVLGPTSPSYSLEHHAECVAMTPRRVRRFVALMNPIIDLSTLYAKTFDGDRQAIRLQINRRVNNLIGDLLDHFEGSVPDGVIRHLISKSAPSNLVDEAVLAALPPGAIPFAFVRELMANRRVAFDFAEMTQWERFTDRYSAALQQAG